MRGLERLSITWDHGLPSPPAGQRKELTHVSTPKKGAPGERAGGCAGRPETALQT